MSFFLSEKTKVEQSGADEEDFASDLPYDCLTKIQSSIMLYTNKGHANAVKWCHQTICLYLF